MLWQMEGQKFIRNNYLPKMSSLLKFEMNLIDLLTFIKKIKRKKNKVRGTSYKFPFFPPWNDTTLAFRMKNKNWGKGKQLLVLQKKNEKEKNKVKNNLIYLLILKPIKRTKIIQRNFLFVPLFLNLVVFLMLEGRNIK